MTAASSAWRPPAKPRPATAGDRVFVFATGAAVALVLAVLATLVIALVVLGGPAVGASLQSGVLSAIYGTALVTFSMTLGVVPVGIVTAIYSNEYAPRGSRFVRMVRAAVHALAGVPSIVFGLFGLGFFVLFVGGIVDRVGFSGAAQPVFGRPCVLWASATLAVLNLPVVIVTTEEALRAVSRELRESVAALGATKLQGITKIILPAARTGILTGVVLATSRGAGEVAAILFTGVASYVPHPPTDLRDGFMHLGYHVYVLATQAPDVDGGVLFASALLLVVVTVGLSSIALVLRDRARPRS